MPRARPRAVPPAHDRPAPAGSTPAPPASLPRLSLPKRPHRSLPSRPRPCTPFAYLPFALRSRISDVHPGWWRLPYADGVVVRARREHALIRRIHATELTLPAPCPGRICRRRPDSRCHVYTLASVVERWVSKVLGWVEDMDNEYMGG